MTQLEFRLLVIAFYGRKKLHTTKYARSLIRYGYLDKSTYTITKLGKTYVSKKLLMGV